MNGQLRCKFCKWTTKKWTTRKRDKKRVHGYEGLVAHIQINHPEKFEKIDRRLKETD